MISKEDRDKILDGLTKWVYIEVHEPHIRARLKSAFGVVLNSLTAEDVMCEDCGKWKSACACDNKNPCPVTDTAISARKSQHEKS